MGVVHEVAFVGPVINNGRGAVGDILIPNIEFFRSAPIARPLFSRCPRLHLEKIRTLPGLQHLILYIF
jgi:hypothetical protein